MNVVNSRRHSGVPYALRTMGASSQLSFRRRGSAFTLPTPLILHVKQSTQTHGGCVLVYRFGCRFSNRKPDLGQASTALAISHPMLANLAGRVFLSPQPSDGGGAPHVGLPLGDTSEKKANSASRILWLARPQTRRRCREFGGG